MIRLHMRRPAQDVSIFDVQDMTFDEAAELHAAGVGAFRVSARTAEVPGVAFQRMSIAVADVVRVTEMAS